MVTAEQLQALWEEIKRRVKALDLNRPLWRAIDVAVPITMDGRTLVIGLSSEHQHEASTFDIAENKTTLQKVLANVANKPLQLLVIDGTSEAEYQAWQERQRVADELRRRQVERLESPGDEDELPTEEEDAQMATSVNRVMLQLNRELHLRYRDTKNRSQSLTKARFLVAALADVHEAEDRLEELDGSPALKERQVSRSLQKLGDMISVDPVLVALEYERYKRERGFLTRD